MLRAIAAFLIGFTLMFGVLGSQRALGMEGVKDNNPFSGATSMRITMTKVHKPRARAYRLDYCSGSGRGSVDCPRNFPPKK